MGVVFDKSIFKEFLEIDTAPTTDWRDNVLDKLYKDGIVPNYLVRRIQASDDEDYIAFWKTVAGFYALIVCYAREFEFSNLSANDKMFILYVRQKGLIVFEGMSLSDMQTLMYRFYYQIAQRGTSEIIRRGSIDGELLRLINIDKDIDEFIFNITVPEKVGWNIGNSSPCYRGSGNQVQLNKAPEDTQDFVDLSNFTTVGTVAITTDGSKDVATLSGVSSLETPSIIIDPHIAYEITFQIQQDIKVENIKLSVSGKDSNNNTLSFIDIHTGSANNIFLNNFDLPEVSTSGFGPKYYFVRCIIYANNTSLLSTANAHLNIGAGVNLKFDALHNFFKFKIDNLDPIGSGAEVNIWDFKIRPLLTDYSMGFIHSSRIIQMWLKNNEQKYTDIDLEDIIKTDLIPFNEMIKINHFDNNFPLIGNIRCAVADSGSIHDHQDGYDYHEMIVNFLTEETFNIYLDMFKINGVSIITSTPLLTINVPDDLIFTTGLNGSDQFVNITQWLNAFTTSDKLYFFDDMAVAYHSPATTSWEIRMRRVADGVTYYYKYTEGGFFFCGTVNYTTSLVTSAYTCVPS